MEENIDKTVIEELFYNGRLNLIPLVDGEIKYNDLKHRIMAAGIDYDTTIAECMDMMKICYMGNMTDKPFLENPINNKELFNRIDTIQYKSSNEMRDKIEQIYIESGLANPKYLLPSGA